MARPRTYNEYTISTSFNLPKTIFEKLDYIASQKRMSRSAIVTAILSAAMSQDVDKFISENVNTTTTETKIKDIIKAKVYEKEDRIINSYEKNKGSGITTTEIIKSFINILIEDVKYELTKENISISDKKAKDLISFYILEIMKNLPGGE
jgi:predicted transcriptional regulator